MGEKTVIFLEYLPQKLAQLSPKFVPKPSARCLASLCAAILCHSTVINTVWHRYVNTIQPFIAQFEVLS